MVVQNLRYSQQYPDFPVDSCVPNADSSVLKTWPRLMYHKGLGMASAIKANPKNLWRQRSARAGRVTRSPVFL